MARTKMNNSTRMIVLAVITCFVTAAVVVVLIFINDPARSYAAAGLLVAMLPTSIAAINLNAKIDTVSTNVERVLNGEMDAKILRQVKKALAEHTFDQPKA